MKLLDNSGYECGRDGVGYFFGSKEKAVTHFVGDEREADDDKIYTDEELKNKVQKEIVEADEDDRKLLALHYNFSDDAEIWRLR